jgi:adenylyl-sulfate kinase
VVREDATGGGASAPQSPHVTWHGGALSRERRWRELGAGGVTLWFTGLPASGKSTIAAAVEERLVEAGRPAYLLDGDNLRHGLNGNLGFSDDDRRENIRRTAHVACLLADAGLVTLVSLVSPFREDRDRARELHRREELPFLEVWVSTSAEECERRDPKGLYARARRGELPGLTGVSAPYEPPLEPELEIGGEVAVEEAVERVLALLPAAAGS